MSNEKRKYDSTVARIAGNIAGHVMANLMSIPGIQGTAPADAAFGIATSSVAIARAIVAETIRTEPVARTEPERE